MQPFHAIDVYAIVENVPQRDQVALTVEDGQSSFSTSQLTYVGTLVNRLTPILHDKFNAGNSANSTLEYTTIVNNIKVPVVFQGVIQYDNEGLVVYESGTVQSRVVQYDSRTGRHVLSDFITIDFTLDRSEVEYSVFMILCFVAASVGVFAVPAVLKVEEATIFTRPEIQVMFPYIQLFPYLFKQTFSLSGFLGLG